MAKSDRLMHHAQRLQLHQLASLTTYAMSLRAAPQKHLYQDHMPKSFCTLTPQSSGTNGVAAKDAHMVAAMLHQVALAPTDKHRASARSGTAFFWRREWGLSGLTSELQVPCIARAKMSGGICKFLRTRFLCLPRSPVALSTRASLAYAPSVVSSGLPCTRARCSMNRRYMIVFGELLFSALRRHGLRMCC